jgi:hypothetical protein
MVTKRVYPRRSRENADQLCTVAVFRSEILSYRQGTLIFNSEREEHLFASPQQNVKTHPPINGWTNRPEIGLARNTMAMWELVKPAERQ